MQPSRRGSSPTNPKVSISTSTERRGAAVLFSRMFGHVTGADVEQMHAEIAKLLGTQRGGAWLVDTRGVTGFDPVSLPPAATTMLRELKSRDIAVIAVVTLSPVRMMGSTLCFAAGVRHRFFEGLEEVERYTNGLSEQR